MLETMGFFTVIAMITAVGWILINDIVMPFLWEVASTTLKSVFKALISKIRKEEINNNM